MAKGKFKLQYINQHDLLDRRFGNKKWLPVWDDNGQRGYTMTRDEASSLYRELSGLYPSVTYRIKECR